MRDPQKRKKYDETRNNENKGFSYFEQNNNYDNDNSVIQEELKNDWEIVIEFIPSAEKLRSQLEKLSPSLSIYYQLKLITDKSYDKINEIAAEIKHEFLRSYFGDDRLIQSFAESLIYKNRKDAAHYLNNVIRVMGTPKNRFDVEDLKEKILVKFDVDNYNSYKEKQKRQQEQYKIQLKLELEKIRILQEEKEIEIKKARTKDVLIFVGFIIAFIFIITIIKH